ncbi:hybrid sensor histidine kinase/response regulator transcription factor [Dinghuibacter silviterrae]|uniref:histidine kinase n=1 Tax=Dinghuibacter silviterrae TaxID=1539049 RepID=A0A4R8DVU0_9BACT|nr:two-component regulator propeller domain-containing protein [Dinghuibacter silviterrae]TDX02048.1 two component regulator with propeller domain [Dinghuibacter silviterrae]
MRFWPLLFLSLRLAADPTVPVQHLGIERGLSNNSVRCIFQDHLGFMWFGTYDGLSRYDGYEFTVFRNKLNDGGSLPYNYIYAIDEDPQGNIWVGTGQGIGIYNPATGKFSTAAYYAYKSRERWLVNFNVTALKIDKTGDVFIGTNGWGLHVRRAGEDAAHQLPFAERTGYYVPSIVIDPAERVWVFVQGAGLCRYEKGALQLVSAGLKSVNCMTADEDGNLWMGTLNGVYRYTIATGAIEHVNVQMSSTNVCCVAMDHERKLWIGTEGGGMDILDTRTNTMEFLLPGEGKYNLTSESVYAIYQDKESRYWIGTLKGGVDLLDGQQNRFRTVSHDPLNPNSLINNFVSAFFEDGDHRLWIGTDGGGMSIWDRAKNKFTNYHRANGGLSNNSITSICEDRQHAVWVGTFGGGVNRFDPATGRCTHYACINDQTEEENKNVWVVYEDRDGNLWASTFENGRLYRLDRAKNRFVVFDQAYNDLISLSEDRKGTLWGGNSRELFKIDKSGRQHTTYDIGKPIRALYEDHKGRFWLGTEGGGLLLFDRDSGKVVTQYADADGLCNNSVLNILEDDHGFLWLSTFNGLSRFDPGHKVFKNFYQGDGLQSNQFLYSAALRLQTGELAFGGIKGFNIFYPDSIRPRNYMPPLRITGLRVDNQPYTGALRIPYNKAVLSFDFAALEYSAPANVSYAYLLEGWDKTWNYTRNVRTANYTNLSEGSYRLRIRSTNAEGVWNPEETTLDIRVLPPWYRSVWAYILYALLAATLVYFYRRYRLRQAQLEKEKEINEKRLSFFTSISHEFRTPLTLIINPLKDILHQDKGENQEIRLVFRNARRLLSLVDQLLLFRKAESGADRLKIGKVHIQELCREVYLAFLQKARAEQIDYTFDGGDTDPEVYVDREKMEIVFYNLLSNALKYTPPGGRVHFRLFETADTVDITVSDTGKGVPPGTGDKLFEKFYQASGHATGFGIGLYLVKQFVKSHGGKVSYESAPGAGTTFAVSLRKGKRHFGAEPVFEMGGDKPVILEELAGEGDPEGEDTGPLAGGSRRAGPDPAGSGGRAGAGQAAGEAPAGALGPRPVGTSILIIDDNDSMRQYVAQIFADRYTVYQAANGEEGLELARLRQPDIVITDIMMQPVSGIELCKTLKDDLALGHIPVILLTGSPSQETELQGMEGGADDYVTKPFDKEILLARVAGLLKNRNNLQRYFYNEVTLQRNNLKISEEDKAFIDRCIRVVQDHIDDDDFMIKTLAQEMGMSHSGLYKRIKAVSGQSVNGFIRFIRLRRVAELLINTDKNVSEAALEAGFNDLKYFREQFSKLFGMMPSEYVRKFRPPFSKNLNFNR